MRLAGWPASEVRRTVAPSGHGCRSCSLSLTTAHTDMILPLLRKTLRGNHLTSLSGTPLRSLGPSMLVVTKHASFAQARSREGARHDEIGFDVAVQRVLQVVAAAVVARLH